MKNLPIQLVEFRGQQDEFIQEPIGSSKLPKWITEHEDIYYANSARVHEQLSLWDSLFEERERQHNDMPLLFEVELSEHAEAKSYRKDIKATLNVGNVKNVIGMTDRRTLLVKANNRAELRQMSSRFVTQRRDDLSKQQQKAYASIVNTNLFHAKVDEYEDGETLKIRLVDYQDPHHNESCVTHLSQLCETFGQPCEKLDYVEGLRLYKTKAASTEFVQHLASMDGILSIGGMPTYGIDFEEIASNEDMDYEYPEGDKTYPMVGLLDTGVVDAVPFQPWKDGATQIPDEWANVCVRKHGSCVASILLYGDKLCGENRTGAGPSKIRDCVVNIVDTGNAVDEDKLVGYIKKAIANNPDVKIWNCSMGSKSEAPMSRISDFAKTLDKLQQDANVLICKSAGNKREDYDRITNGADSLLSVVVGSTSIAVNQEGELEEGWSPNSCVGLAAGSVIKPDLANLGGDKRNLIRVINENGWIIENGGTSFATPRITAMAANLAHQLGDQYSPLLIKALLAHFATYPKGMKDEELEEKIKKVGYGVPAPIYDILYNDENEITMIFPYRLRKGVDCRAIQFIYPEGLIENGYYYGDITLTMVTSPILNVNQDGEYCQTNVEVALHTYDSATRVDLNDPDTPRSYKNPIRLEGSKNVLAESNYSHSRNREGVLELFECNRIDKKHKYSPIKKYHVDLAQMKPAPRNDLLSGTRQWALRLIPEFREETQSSHAAGDLTFEAYLIMTIRDPKQKGVVYNQALEQLEAKNFVHHNLVIRQDVEVENEA